MPLYTNLRPTLNDEPIFQTPPEPRTVNITTSDIYETVDEALTVFNLPCRHCQSYIHIPIYADFTDQIICTNCNTIHNVIYEFANVNEVRPSHTNGYSMFPEDNSPLMKMSQYIYLDTLYSYTIDNQHTQGYLDLSMGTFKLICQNCSNSLDFSMDKDTPNDLICNYCKNTIHVLESYSKNNKR